MKRRRPKAARIGLPHPPLPFTPPRSLRGKRARELWRTLARFVAKEGTHTIKDASLLERWCRLESEIAAYHRFEKELGFDRTAALDVRRIWYKLLHEMLRLGKRLGFSPVHRRDPLLMCQPDSVA